jgi:hypothetical protein
VPRWYAISVAASENASATASLIIHAPTRTKMPRATDRPGKTAAMASAGMPRITSRSRNST